MTDTPDSEDGVQDDGRYDVLIVGGGPAGSSAGVFTARAGLDTLVLEHDRSALRKCAYLENYLGFPAGVEPGLLQDLARDHTRRAGCDRVFAAVRAATRHEGDFRVETDEGSHRGRYLLVTSWADTDYLDALGVETVSESHPGPVEVVVTDDDGETNVDGVYAAGRITETYHQAIVNAGDGARVARAIVEAERPSFYNDWIVPEGYYERHDMAVPEGVEEISHSERREREATGRRVMREFFAE